MLPSIRTRLNNPGKTSEALRQLLNLTYPGVEIESITVVDNGIHNTKLILALPNGVERVVFYNRTDIATMLRSDMINGREINEIINSLKLEGFDFTEDDLEIVENKLSAKSTSLGYIGNLLLATELSGIVSTLELWRDETMAKIRLKWLNELSSTATQVIEKSTGTEPGEWTAISITIEEDVDTGEHYWMAEDTDISYPEDTCVWYRIVTVNGTIRLPGNEVYYDMPAMPVAVSTLSVELINEE